MQTQEQQLIVDLSNRLQQTAMVTKDSEAEALIQRSIANQPDVVYRLVQAVLIQQLTLTQAQHDLTALQQRVQQLEIQQQNTANKPSSFLGGFADKIFGTANPAPTPPPVMNSGSPWQQQQPNPNNNNNAYAAPPPQAAAGGGSSFLASAASSALGVAGGMALFSGVSSLMGSHSASPFGSSSAAGAATATPVETTNVTNNYYSDPNANSDSNADYGNSSNDYDDFGGDDNF
ncbi:DUF2076 domain-containing protein [soil metagenome]